MVLLTSTALAVFWSFYLVDYLWTARSSPAEPSGPLSQYLRFDSGSITDAVGSLAGIIAAVFGIVITVASIIVQLSANRYAGIARRFLRDPANLTVMGYYIITCVWGVWLSVSLQQQYVPRAALIGMMTATTLGLVLIAPYFGYVFWFLDPMNIIARIRKDAERAAASGARSDNPGQVSVAQGRALSAMEELSDIVSSSISVKDKIIASGAVDALKDFALQYAALKPKASPSWLHVGVDLRKNPDFVAMDPESLVSLEQRETWLEWKVMRQYLGIYNEALSSMRDIDYLVAIDTRYIGEAAVENGDRELVQLVFRFMNSYLRASLNHRDVRTSYNVLNQYRLLVEAMIRSHCDAVAVEAVGFMRYYGHVSFDMDLTFVTETVAYDVSALCQYAHGVGSPCESELLQAFLLLDQPLQTQSQEKALLGVRKAQVKLAAYYLMCGETEKAQLIREDMQGEPPERLKSILNGLSTVTSKDFWEVIDRGRNFEYMPEEQRAQVVVFFDAMGIAADDVSRS